MMLCAGVDIFRQPLWGQCDVVGASAGQNQGRSTQCGCSHHRHCQCWHICVRGVEHCEGWIQLGHALQVGLTAQVVLPYSRGPGWTHSVSSYLSLWVVCYARIAVALGKLCHLALWSGCVPVYVCLCVCMCVCLCWCMGLLVCVCVCACICLCPCLCVCVCVCMYVCVCVCVCDIYKCVHLVLYVDFYGK